MDAADGLIIPKEWARQLDSCSQTLAGICKLSHNGQTSASRWLISKTVGLSLRTVEKHIGRLVLRGRLEMLDRRHHTIRIHGECPSAFYHDLHLFLPADYISLTPRWTERCILAYTVSSHMASEGYRGESRVNRCSASVREMCEECGLSTRSVILAKKELVRLGLIRVVRGQLERDSDGRILQQADSLLLA